MKDEKFRANNQLFVEINRIKREIRGEIRNQARNVTVSPSSQGGKGLGPGRKSSCGGSVR